MSSSLQFNGLQHIQLQLLWVPTSISAARVTAMHATQQKEEPLD